jgi:hypothetical protein
MQPNLRQCVLATVTLDNDASSHQMQVKPGWYFVRVGVFCQSSFPVLFANPEVGGTRQIVGATCTLPDL